MNAAHAHLLINHLPLMATTIALPLLVYAMISRTTELFRAVVLVVIIGAIGSGLSLATGGDAKDLVEGFAGVETTTIDAHGHAGQTAARVSITLGWLSLAAFFFERKRPEKRTALLAFLSIGTLVSAGFLGFASHTGGEIRHQETREGFDPNAKPEEAEL